MKITYYFKTLSLSLLGLIPCISFAQWTELPIPMGAYIGRDLTLHKDALFTTFYGSDYKIQLAKTTDKLHWELAATLPASANSGSARTISDGNFLYVTGKNVQASTFDAFVSNDDGANWTQLSWPNQTKTDLFEAWGSTLLAVNDSVLLRKSNSGGGWQSVFQTQGKVYDLKRIGDQAWLMTTETKIYRSTDDGLTWEMYAAPFNATGLNYPRLSIFPTEIGAFVEFDNDTVSTIYRSINLGASWNLFNPPSNEVYFNVRDMMYSNGKLYLSGSGLWSTTDEGLNWESIATPDCLPIENDGSTLFLGGSNGLFKSQDGGKHWWSGNLGWESVLGTVVAPFFIPQIIEYHKGKLYIFSDDEYYVSEDEGQNWLYSQGKSFNPYRKFIAKGDSLLILGRGAERSFDNGNTWEYIPEDTDQDLPLSGGFNFAATRTHVFAATWFGDKFYRSFDWGLNWAPFNLPGDVYFPDNIAGTDNALYLPAYDEIYVSANNGQSFVQANNGLGGSPKIEGLWAAENTPFTQVGNQLFRREGNLWKPATVGLYDNQGNLPFIQDFAGDAGKILLSGSRQTTSKYLLYISGDHGQSWKGGLEVGLPLVDYQFIATLNSNTIYATGIKGFSASGLGLWKREFTVGNKEPRDSEKFRFTLSPNPASQLASLVLEKKESAPTYRLRIYDSIGCLQWAGSMQGENLQIPVDKWPNGVYEVALQDENGEWGIRKLVVQH